MFTAPDIREPQTISHKDYPSSVNIHWYLTNMTAMYQWYSINPLLRNDHILVITRLTVAWVMTVILTDIVIEAPYEKFRYSTNMAVHWNSVSQPGYNISINASTDMCMAKCKWSAGEVSVFRLLTKYRPWYWLLHINCSWLSIRQISIDCQSSNDWHWRIHWLICQSRLPISYMTRVWNMKLTLFNPFISI